MPQAMQSKPAEKHSYSQEQNSQDMIDTLKSIRIRSSIAVEMQVELM
jgi:hypothetical protein